MRNFKNDDLDRETQPRMPWHDVHLMVQGDSAVDIGRHFIEYWNHAKFDKEGKKTDKVDFLKPSKISMPVKNRRKHYEQNSNEDMDIFDEMHEDNSSLLVKQKVHNNAVGNQE